MAPAKRATKKKAATKQAAKRRVAPKKAAAARRTAAAKPAGRAAAPAEEGLVYSDVRREMRSRLWGRLLGA